MSIANLHLLRKAKEIFACDLCEATIFVFDDLLNATDEMIFFGIETDDRSEKVIDHDDVQTTVVVVN